MLILAFLAAAVASAAPSPSPASAAKQHAAEVLQVGRPIVSGKVNPGNGSVGARLFFYSSNGQLSASVTAASDGSFSLPGLEPGTYTIQVLESDRLVPVGRSFTVRASSSGTPPAVVVPPFALPPLANRIASVPTVGPSVRPSATPAPAPTTLPGQPTAAPIPTPTPARIFYATDRAAGQPLFAGLPLDQCTSAPDCMLRYGTIALGTAGPPREVGVFQSALDASLAAGNGRDVVVYVHGCCTTFDTAVDETVLIATRIAQNMPVIAYTMPTKANKTLFGVIPVPAHYFYDENIEIWSAPHFEAFLERLIASGGGQAHVHVIAHSLGTRLVLSALELYQLRHPVGPKRLGEIVLLAGDLDTATFVEQIPQFTQLADRITVYRSDQDRAILGSSTVHELTRLGRLKGSTFFGAPLVDAIDATEFSCDSTGHFYWKLSSYVTEDIAAVLRGLAPDDSARAGALKATGAHAYVFDAKSRRGPKDCVPVPTRIPSR